MNVTKNKLWTKDLILIIIINFLIFMNHIMILSTFPFYIKSLGGSEAMSGLAAVLFSLIAVICRPFIGWMLDTGKRKVILMIGMAGLILMPIGYIFASIILLAFVFRMLHGFSLACSNTSTSTIATDIIPKARFGEGMGMFGMSTALATSCAPALGLFLMNKMGFQTVFLFAAGSIVTAFILFLLLKVPTITVEKKPLNFKELIDKDALPASTIVLVFLLTFGALENFLSIFATENNLPSGGIFFAIMALMLFLTRVTVGKIADKKGESIFVYTCNASMFAAFLLLSFIPNTVTFYLAAILAGYAFGGIEPALQSMAVRIAPQNRRGSANSTFLCAYDIGIGMGGGIAGFLISFLGYSQMFSILTIANIISVLIYVLWGRKHPSSFSYTAHK